MDLDVNAVRLLFDLEGLCMVADGREVRQRARGRPNRTRTDERIASRRPGRVVQMLAPFAHLDGPASVSDASAMPIWVYLDALSRGPKLVGQLVLKVGAGTGCGHPSARGRES